MDTYLATFNLFDGFVEIGDMPGTQFVILKLTGAARTKKPIKNIKRELLEPLNII